LDMVRSANKHQMKKVTFEAQIYITIVFFMAEVLQHTIIPLCQIHHLRFKRGKFIKRFYLNWKGLCQILRKMQILSSLSQASMAAYPNLNLVIQKKKRSNFQASKWLSCIVQVPDKTMDRTWQHHAYSS
jgi:hypothetical protein